MAIKIPRNQVGIYCIILIVLLIIISAAVSIKGAIDTKNEVVYSDSCEIGDPVYADIISLTPTSGTVKTRNTSTPTYEGYFCTCETVDGKTIDAYISTSRYNHHIEPSKKIWEINGWIPKETIFDTPLRIHGKIMSYSSIVTSSNAKSPIFNIFSADN